MIKKLIKLLDALFISLSVVLIISVILFKIKPFYLGADYADILMWHPNFGNYIYNYIHYGFFLFVLTNFLIIITNVFYKLKTQKINFYGAINRFILVCFALTIVTFFSFSNITYYNATDLSKFNNLHGSLGILIYNYIHYGAFILIIIILSLLLLKFVIAYKRADKTMYFKTFSLLLFSLFCFISSEITLYSLNYRYGFTEPLQFFKPVKTLEVFEGFEADSIGITKFPAKAISYNKSQMSKALRTEETNTSFANLYKESNISLSNLYSETYFAWNPYYKVINNEETNDFSRYFKKLNLQIVKSPLDSSIISYVHSPINSEGFKSINFKTKTNAKKVLLLGDSFTYGHHVNNITSGFADILLTKGYAIFNTGISGADIKQYQLIAKQYIPVLKPDVVIVNLYLGNDISYYEREIIPFMPLYYSTNAGNLYTSVKGETISSPQIIYDNIVNILKADQRTFFSRVMSKTLTTTFLWKQLNPVPEKINALMNDSKTRTVKYLKEIQEIQEIAKENGARCLIVSIPNYRDNKLTYAQEYKAFFENFKYYEPTNLTNKDYVPDNGHFNEEGHQKHADFLDNLLTNN